MARHYAHLDHIVRNYLIELGRDTEHGYQRYLAIAVMGLKELNFDVTQELRSAQIEIDSSTRSIQLPSDFVRLTRVGICKNGRIAWLAEDRNLCLPNKDKWYDWEKGGTGEGGQALPTPPNTTGSDPIEAYEKDTPVYTTAGQVYGLGGGQNQNGYYRFDIENEVIYFSSGVTGPIQLEYLTDYNVFTPDNYASTSGTKNHNNLRIHKFAVEALTAYIYWKDVQRKRKVPQNEKLAARAEYYNQKRLARARFHTINKDKILTISRKAFKQSPKI